MKAIGKTALTTILAAMDVGGDLFAVWHCGLAGPDFDPNTVDAVTDVVQPTFTGYTPENIAAVTPAVDGTGHPIMVGDEITFTPSDAVGLPQPIYGAWVSDGDGNILAIGKFAAPLVVSQSGQLIRVTPTVTLNSKEPAVFEGHVAD